jgi:hypothetical protein
VLRALAQVGLWLYGNDFGDRRGVVSKVRAAAGADLDYTPAQIHEQPLSVLGSTTTLGDLSNPLIHASKDRMTTTLDQRIAFVMSG